MPNPRPTTEACNRILDQLRARRAKGCMKARPNNNPSVSATGGDAKPLAATSRPRKKTMVDFIDSGFFFTGLDALRCRKRTLDYTPQICRIPEGNRRQKGGCHPTIGRTLARCRRRVTQCGFPPVSDSADKCRRHFDNLCCRAFAERLCRFFDAVVNVEHREQLGD